MILRSVDAGMNEEAVISSTKELVLSLDTLGLVFGEVKNALV